MILMHLATGGPIYQIDTPKRTYFFEWHPHCGPMLLRKDLEPRKRYSQYAMEQIQKWIDQGKSHRLPTVLNPHRLCEYEP